MEVWIMTDKLNDYNIDELEQRLELQNKRIHHGMYWLFGGALVTVLTIESPVQIVAWGAIVYGLADIINGNFQKSRLKKMLPDDLIPSEINCTKCGTTLELDQDERIIRKYFCPKCNQTYHYTADST